MGNNLKKIREDRGLTLLQMAGHMGVSRSHYIKFERGERGIDVKYIQNLAEALKMPQGEIIEEKDPIPIVGYVGASSEAVFFEEGQGPFGEAPSIDGAMPSTVAVEIRGTSLGPIFDRWLAYYDDLRTPPTSDLVGKLCVVGLEDERVLIKYVARSRGYNRFDLSSNTEQPMFDVLLRWAAEVKDMKPR